jgi:hypothetical protein
MYVPIVPVEPIIRMFFVLAAAVYGAMATPLAHGETQKR